MTGLRAKTHRELVHQIETAAACLTEQLHSSIRWHDKLVAEQRQNEPLTATYWSDVTAYATALFFLTDDAYTVVLGRALRDLRSTPPRAPAVVP